MPLVTTLLERLISKSEALMKFPAAPISHIKVFIEIIAISCVLLNKLHKPAKAEDIIYIAKLTSKVRLLFSFCLPLPRVWYVYAAELL